MGDLLQVAVICHNEMVRKLLALRRPGAPWHRTDLGSTAFSVCCLSGNVEAARMLCDTGEISLDLMSSPNELGASPIHLAAGSGHVELVELILTHRGEGGLAEGQLLVCSWKFPSSLRQLESPRGSLPTASSLPCVSECEGRSGQNASSDDHRRQPSGHWQPGANWAL